jgi:hypothetical protein
MSKNIENYFPSLNVPSLDWLRVPFVLSVFESAELAVAEEETLMEIRNDKRLKLKHSSTDMASFWLSLRQEYTFTTKRATEARLLSLRRICVRLASLL